MTQSCEIDRSLTDENALHCPLARRITGFKHLNINPDLLAQNSTFRWDEPALHSTKWLSIDSGEGSFRCLRDIFLCVFLKAAAFQKTLAGEEKLFIAGARIGTKITLRPTQAQPRPLFQPLQIITFNCRQLYVYIPLVVEPHF